MKVTLTADLLDETGDCLTIRLHTGYGAQIIPVDRGSVEIAPSVVMAKVAGEDPT